jgi:2-keto-4-pentenoate hydratase/2-oxohepta-3-ene-1,7-dioic acid hydratase in catechol pathway
MKLMSFVRPTDQLPSWGIATDAGVIDLGKDGSTLRDALGNMAAIAAQAGRTPDFKLEDVTFLPTITNPDKIICIGVNYKTHQTETGRAPQKYPMIFARWPNSHVGQGVPLVRPHASETFDYEGELAVIISKTCRHVKAADAYSVVAGYACYNDGTIREFQRHTVQFHPGKNFFQSGSFGPWMVTPDEMGPIGSQHLITRLNGVEVQRATIDDLIFDIPALIEYCSTFTQLEPGDVIATGTTGGVGAYHTPPLWMKPGDVVEVDIGNVGVLRNSIVQED